jgi:hypothetical protein
MKKAFQFQHLALLSRQAQARIDIQHISIILKGVGLGCQVDFQGHKLGIEG